MTMQLTDERLAQIEQRTWSKHPLTLTDSEARALIAEVRRLRGENAMLTDTVVMAAALWFAQLDGPQGDYASEVLHGTAKDLVKRHPRLAGSFRPEV